MKILRKIINYLKEYFEIFHDSEYQYRVTWKK